MKKIISFDLYADMGFLKKPDINEKIYLTYNILHKPCVLGILGAIAGLGGFKKNNTLPEYYEQLNHLPVGVKPIGEGCENGNFNKNVTAYTNTVGYANSDGTHIVSEQTLIKPAYRIYLLLDLDNEVELGIYEGLRNQTAEYIPYLGKNDYSAWWDKDTVREYDVKLFEGDRDFKIETVFIKESPVVNNVVKHRRGLRSKLHLQNGTFMYFEKLPVNYNEELYQYNYDDFAYTDWTLGKDSVLDNLYEINEKVIQLN